MVRGGEGYGKLHGIRMEGGFGDPSGVFSLFISCFRSTLHASLTHGFCQ